MKKTTPQDKLVKGLRDALRRASQGARSAGALKSPEVAFDGEAGETSGYRGGKRRRTGSVSTPGAGSVGGGP